MSDLTLPNGWHSTFLDSIASWGSGGTPSRKVAAYYGGDIPWVKTGDLGNKYLNASTEFITAQAVKKSSAKLFKKGSVAIAMYGATIGKTSILGIDCTTNQACAVGQPNQATDTEFLYYLLINEKSNFIAQGKGGAQPNISQTIIKAHSIVLPPLAEQEKIVRLLQQHLAQVEQIKAHLEAIPKLLTTFRQSVLADAVNGKLTEDWRGNNNIDNWEYITIGEISDVKTGNTPSRKNPKYWEDVSVPWLTSSATGEDFCRQPKEYVSKVAVKECNLKLHPVGSLMLAMYGEGKTRGQVTELMFEATCNQACAIIIVNDDVNHRYVKIRLKEHYAEIRLKASGGNQPNLNLSKVRGITINIPPLKEQHEIVSRVEELFAFADNIERQVQSATKHVNLLTQSILAKAFRGELTADWREQNPELISGDNSAEALLAKIQAQMKVDQAKKKTKS